MKTPEALIAKICPKMCPSIIRVFVYSILLLQMVPKCSAQQCAASDLTIVQNCGNTTKSILASIQSRWPIPSPLPNLNNTIVTQLCTAYTNYLACISPKSSTCGTVQEVVNIINVVGYVCVDKQNLFSTQSDCIKNYLASPDSLLTNCMNSAQEIQFHNLLTTATDECNSYKDASSCVYPLVQVKCGSSIGNALQEFSKRVVQTLATNCDLSNNFIEIYVNRKPELKCDNTTYCMYDETCRSGRTCQCAIVCPVQNTPQCSSDSGTYGNSCLMRKQACNQRLWLIERPTTYCTLQDAYPSICTDTNVDQYAHCIVPLYNGMIASFQDLASYLSNFNSFMINRTCSIYQQTVSCSLSVPTVCRLSNGATLDELYQNYVCTNQGYKDLTSNTDCWQKLGTDMAFQQCSQDFTYTIEALQYYSNQMYVDSFINDFGGVCTGLNTLGSCVLPRVQALCSAQAVSVFNKVFNTYNMFKINCGSVCKSLVENVYGIISSNNWPAANTDAQKCTWQLVTPSGMNVNLLLRVNKPFDCYPDNPSFISIYSGSSEDNANLLYTYCGQNAPDNVFSTSVGVNQMTVVYTKTMSNSGASPPFVAMFYAGTDACLSNPCVGGSSCHNTAGGYYCQCQAGYTGSLCNRYVGKCNVAVCKNGGTCVDTFVITDISMANGDDASQDFGYYCRCPSGFGGDTCQSSSSTNPEKADFQCPSPFIAFGQECYFVNSSQIAEPNSEDACKSAGPASLLGSIHSEAERTFVQSLMQQSGATAVWIGARHVNTTWFWLDNTPFNYNAWFVDPPNLSLRCVIQSANLNYTWITENCYPNVNAYFCKMSPPISCNVNPCLNGGSCVTTGTVNSCTCTANFTGSLCGSLTTCTPNPCLNGGQCRSANGINSCACPTGYNGTFCETNGGACNSNPCQNSGRCSVVGGAYSCACLLGYSGTNCEVNINECASNPCLNGGNCSDGINRFSCSCASGFTGLTCNININECASSPCLNGGTCRDGVNSYTCACASGYSGNNCQTAPSSCTTVTCSNGGTCLTSGNSFVCLCATGYTGNTCQSSVNYCSPNPCINGGTCSSTNTGFLCSCLAGYAGNSCQILINNCASNPCLNGATCTSTTSGYTCSCLNGYSGFNCQNTNTGNVCNPNPCANGATCIVGTNQFSCQCASGYYGPTCSATSGLCDTNSCFNNGSCIDLNGAYTCSCPTGYSGTQCQYANTNVCSSNNPCLNGGFCSYSQGVTVCSCPSTFQGPTCFLSGSNLCSNFPCLNGGTCISGIDYYICLCPSAYTGTNCETLVAGACLSSPCQNNGQCVTTVNGFYCNCASGYTGTVCNINTNTGVCVGNLCQNAATCSPISSTSYVCICQSGYSGFYCDQSSNPCLSNPCQNGGVCSQGLNSYQCQCLTGFVGPTCSQATGAICSINPCQNSGLCITLSSTQYLCRCQSGWTGASCEVDINECLQLPCLNGATCTNTVGSYYCTCASGYSGFDCNFASNPCVSNPCTNGGNCTALSGSTGYTCSCLPEFTGQNCAARLCQSNWKYYGGYCYLVVSNTVSQSNSQTTCTANNSNLASVHDVNERNFVAAIMAASNVNQAWIGALYNASSNNFYWADQTPWSYTSWASGQPLSPSTLQCVRQILQNGVTWETENCNNAEPTLCKTNAKIYAIASACASKPCQNNGSCSAYGGSYVCTCLSGFGGTNCQSLTTSCTPNPCSNGGTCSVVGTSSICTCTANFTVNSNCQVPCPAGWYWFIGKCYLPVNNLVTYQTALNDCPSRQTGSKLFYSDTQDDFYFACTLANRMSSNIWLGLQYESSTNKYRWSHGKYLGPNEYKAWGNNQPSNQNVASCVQITGLAGFVWESYSCTTTLKYVCKWDGSAF